MTSKKPTDASTAVETSQDSARRAYVTRDAIMKLLSDEEVSSVSAAESTQIGTGEEYIDLEKLDAGVQRAPLTKMHMGPVLPKRAVHTATWAKIVSALAS